MPTPLLAMLFSDALAGDPLDLSEPGPGEGPISGEVPEETPAEPAAPASPPTSATPVLDALGGTWFVTSTVEGKESVVWGCSGHPTSVEMDSQAIILTIGAEPLGGAVKGQQTRGDTLVLKTTLAACAEPKEVKLRWADPGHHVLEIQRCEGSPRTVRAVRDLASGVPVLRQCCDPTGKVMRHVTTEAPCPTGSQGQKPTPLRR